MRDGAAKGCQPQLQEGAEHLGCVGLAGGVAGGLLVHVGDPVALNGTRLFGAPAYQFCNAGQRGTTMRAGFAGA